MPTRNDACNQYEESFEVTALDRRLRQLRVAGYKGIGILHFIIAAYIRGISMLPGINRFVVGRRIYARDNIEIVMTVKRAISLDATETTIKVVFEPTDTIFDVYRKMNEKIDEIKTSEGNNNTEDVAESLCKSAALPAALRAVHSARYGLLRLAAAEPCGRKPVPRLHDYHRRRLLRIGPIFHHIYNFGTLPVFIAFGSKRHAYEIDRHGQVVDHKYVDCKFVMDERTVDGHYYAQFLQAIRYLFQHPEILEAPPTKVVEDVY